ncbi:thymidylate synthase, flavin-dependent [Desulfurobacterium thermolithotrophum DSM 11699]|uniref:FAD-dependent thymidylate synthase n=2 Tax=Desulfurobacterium thermolithotrophum TaxID=64160 RepID=F0S236_DESTD|nr:thymidylate synthase, flavin-dependent [Desulfurobacterium thermolithotrophum DSM 11699]
MEVLLLSENVPPLEGNLKVLLRHSHFTFLVDGISRACSHQLVRHRPASYSQQSQRYVAMKNFPYVIPESVRKKKVEIEGKTYSYNDVMMFIGKFYEALVEEEVPKEDARFVLPNACTTRIVFTMNGEELIHFLRLRTCTRAQWEIRKVAIKMLKILREKHPSLFKSVGPNCYYLGYCTEGKKSCGRQKEMKAYFSSLCKEMI